MKTAVQAITGKENFSDLKEPVQALAQFYCAFNNRDMDMMSQNWHQTEEIAMDNPLGGIKRGWNEIKEVYEKIFNGPAKVYVEYYDYSIHVTKEIFYSVGRERGTFVKGDKTIDLKIRTTRVFKLVNGTWKQVHHHGSIEYPELLKEYQDVVLGKNLE
ncbi:MAG: nuclear transport factor 2 family protein [bacterium]